MSGAPTSCALLDSLYRGYPSGAILIWETDERLPEHKQVQRITR
jgi:hypothetical protein